MFHRTQKQTKKSFFFILCKTPHKNLLETVRFTNWGGETVRFTAWGGFSQNFGFSDEVSKQRGVVYSMNKVSQIWFSSTREAKSVNKS